jgi:hypothetical protein
MNHRMTADLDTEARRTPAEAWSVWIPHKRPQDWREQSDADSFQDSAESFEVYLDVIAPAVPPAVASVIAAKLIEHLEASAGPVEPQAAGAQ